MNIAKGLKVKARLIGEIQRLKDIIRRENSRRNDVVSTIDLDKTLELINNQTIKLIALKKALNVSTAQISGQLAHLAELKSLKEFYEEIPIRENTEYIRLGEQTVPYKWNAHFNRQWVDSKIEETQKAINVIQDFVDDFNGRTRIDFDE